VVAQLTQGRFFAANDAGALLAAYQDIDGWERDSVETFRYRRYHEYSGALAVFALGVMTCLSAMRRTVWRRIP
jgi:hypothetical protein